MKDNKLKIVMIGAGRLATQLACELNNVGHNIIQCYSRTIAHAKELASVPKCGAVCSLQEISRVADLYIIALSDGAIPAFIQAFDFPAGAMAVHLSGSLDMDLFAGKLKNYGVLYPVQSFNKERKPDFKSIPLCLEAPNAYSMEILEGLARTLGGPVYKVDSLQRKQLHLAAVFANNFTNHLYHISSGLLEKKDLSFELLVPLIKEGVERLGEASPKELQTGPARRKDMEVINEHIKMLSGEKDFADIYDLITKSIIKSDE